MVYKIKIKQQKHISCI